MTDSHTQNQTSQPHYVEVPKEAVAPFRGVSAVQAGLSRGALFGLGGWLLGNWIGGVGSKAAAAADFNRLGHQTMGGIMGATGFILGAYIAMRQAQEAARQHYALQKSLAEATQALEALGQPSAAVSQATDDGRVQAAQKQISA